MSLKLPRYQRMVRLVDGSGMPTMENHRWWDNVCGRIEAQEERQDETLTDLRNTQAALSDAIENISLNYVIKGSTETWAVPTGTFDRTTFATFAGITASAAYAPAELQAVSDEVKSLSERLAALVNDLIDKGILSQ